MVKVRCDKIHHLFYLIIFLWYYISDKTQIKFNKKCTIRGKTHGSTFLVILFLLHSSVRTKV